MEQHTTEKKHNAKPIDYDDDDDDDEEVTKRSENMYDNEDDEKHKSLIHILHIASKFLVIKTRPIGIQPTNGGYQKHITTSGASSHSPQTIKNNNQQHSPKNCKVTQNNTLKEYPNLKDGQTNSSSTIRRRMRKLRLKFYMYANQKYIVSSNQNSDTHLPHQPIDGVS